MAQYTITKAKMSYVNLLTDLIQTTVSVLDEKRLSVKDVQFAKYNSSGVYTFLPNKASAWEILNTVATTVAKRHPGYRQGEIVDLLADLVNTTVKDELEKRSITIAKHVVNKEKDFLHILLLDAYKTEYLAFFPWLRPIAKLSDVSWQVKNLCSNAIITVKKKVTKDFVEYSN